MSENLKITSDFQNNVFVRLFNWDDPTYAVGFCDFVVKPGETRGIDVEWYNKGSNKRAFQIEFKVSRIDGDLYGDWIKLPWVRDSQDNKVLDIYDLDGCAGFQIHADSTWNSVPTVLPQPAVIG